MKRLVLLFRRLLSGIIKALGQQMSDRQGKRERDQRRFQRELDLDKRIGPG